MTVLPDVGPEDPIPDDEMQLFHIAGGSAKKHLVTRILKYTRRQNIQHDWWRPKTALCRKI